MWSPRPHHFDSIVSLQAFSSQPRQDIPGILLSSIDLVSFGSLGVTEGPSILRARRREHGFPLRSWMGVLFFL